jgi:hypothetical protein
MAAELIMLFARTEDHAAVARRLRELAPGVRIDGPDAGWREAVVPFGGWLRKRTLTFRHDPEYHEEPNWSVQMNGLQGYLDQFPPTERKPVAVMLPTTFRYALVVQCTPEPRGLNAGGDPRLDVLYAVAELLDGVLFTPSALRDARGRVLFSAGGAADEDPQAAWPRVVAAVRVAAESRAAGEHEDEDADGAEGAEAPSAERVARRALALTALSVRGVMEGDARDPRTPAMYQDLLAWVEQAGLADELEAKEAEVLRRPLGGLDPQAATDAVWTLEGLGVLAWALGRSHLPPHDELVHPHALWDAMGLMDAEGARALVAQAALRPRDEILTLRERLFALHWRLRNYGIRPNVMDFAEFARTAWFGPLNITGLPLADGDLSIEGRRIDRAPPEALGRAGSVAHERHKAANWLWEGPALYSLADTST